MSSKVDCFKDDDAFVVAFNNCTADEDKKNYISSYPNYAHCDV